MPGLSSRPASRTACGYWPRLASRPRPIPLSNAACSATPRKRFQHRLAAACAGLGPSSLVLFDVSTLYFETDKADGFREPGYSKQRRLEPQITIGLLTDASGFPLTVEAFEGNRGQKPPPCFATITAFMAAHRLPDVTVVADAGMISDGARLRVHPRRVIPGAPVERD